VPDGKIAYLEIPATDVDKSAEFFTKVFGWTVRTRGDGSRAFDDTTGAVSGTWVKGRAPSREAGILTYIMVNDVDATLKKVNSAGGKTVMPKTRQQGIEAIATFHDPAGNLFGVFQERGS
jgi:predicted enzyme related to lactoylglutathione lyase